MADRVERGPAARDERVERLARRYGAGAAAYRRHWAPVLLTVSRSLLDDLPLARATRVLDLGAGVGALVPELSRRCPNGTVYAVDRSLGMLRLADPKVPRSTMDASRLGFRSASFDVLVAAFMLFHLPDPRLGLAEARRALRRGGVIGLATWGTDRQGMAWAAWNDELDRFGVPPRDPSSVLANHELMDSPGKLRRMLADAGLGSVRIKTVRLGLRPSSERFIAMQRYFARDRVASLDRGARSACIDAAVARIRELPEDQLADDSDVHIAVAAKR